MPVPLALGRVPAEPVAAPHALPGFARSTVDGYAVRAADTYGASEGLPGYLEVTGAVRMGHEPDVAVGPGTAVSMPTGGVLPPGADAVVMVEYTQQAMTGTIEVVRPVAPGDGVARKQPVEDFGNPAGHFIAIAHSHTRAGLCRLNFPALHSADAVGILELPFEHAATLEFRHDHCMRNFAFTQPAGQTNLEAVAKLDRSALHFKLQIHLAAVPRPHAMGNEKCADNFRRRRDFLFKR